MDNSPLNEAHYRHRKAEASMRQHRYDDAIDHHKRAAELLEKSVNLTTSALAAESIKLQRDYHIKQQDLITAKKDREQEHKKKCSEKQDLAKKKDEMSKRINIDPSKDQMTPINIKAAVNRTMDDADSLLLFLVKKHNGEPISFNNVNEEDITYKQPKSDDTIIEELQTVNQQLRTFISQLFDQLEELKLESQTLKSQLRSLESGEHNIHNESLILEETSPEPSPTEPPIVPLLTVMTESIGDNSSPFVFSPASDLSPEDNDSEEIKELPPLELPSFDFKSMMNELKAKREANKCLIRKDL